MWKCLFWQQFVKKLKKKEKVEKEENVDARRICAKV
jgi:hypothetical protein